VFDQRADLVARLRAALALDQGEIARLRRNVITYYDAHMRPDTFIERVERHPDRAFPILMYTERNVARHTKRLGRHSILMQGTTTPRQRGPLTGTIKRLLEG